MTALVSETSAVEQQPNKCQKCGGVMELKEERPARHEGTGRYEMRQVLECACGNWLVQFVSSERETKPPPDQS